MIQKMKCNLKYLGAGLAVGLLCTATFLPTAHGELVFDEQSEASESAETNDRDNLRSALSSSHKAQVTTTTVAQVSAPEVQNMSKAELMRRERMREELKNEDILQERLEQLRLRDERRRTDKLLGAESNETMEGETAPSGAAVAPTGSVVVLPPTQEVVGQEAPIMVAQAAPVVVAPAAPTVVSGVSAASGSAVSSDEEVTQITVSPRAGISNLSGNQYYNVQARYSAGVGIGIAASDNVAFEVGYQYSEYGINLATTNPWVSYMQPIYNGGFGANNQTYALRQNLLDAGIRLYMLGRDSKVRPFIGAGAGYAKSFMNFDSSIIGNLRNSGFQNLTMDYEVDAFMGNLSAGMELKVTKSISVGLMGKYATVLSARERGTINYAYFTPGYQQYFNAYNYGSNDLEKNMVGASLSRLGFYSVLGSVSFTF